MKQATGESFWATEEHGLLKSREGDRKGGREKETERRMEGGREGGRENVKVQRGPASGGQCIF